MSKFLILGILTTIFVMIGALLPFINAEYNIDDSNEYTGVSTDDLDSGRYGTGLFDVALSILGTFFWTFATIPFWLASIIMIFRIIFWFLVVDILWIG